MEDKDINTKLDEINAKLDKIIKQEQTHYEYNKSFESKFKQWAMFYFASLVADETLLINKR